MGTSLATDRAGEWGRCCPRLPRSTAVQNPVASSVLVPLPSSNTAVDSPRLRRNWDHKIIGSSATWWDEPSNQQWCLARVLIGVSAGMKSCAVRALPLPGPSTPWLLQKHLAGDATAADLAQLRGPSPRCQRHQPCASARAIQAPEAPLASFREGTCPAESRGCACNERCAMSVSHPDIDGQAVGDGRRRAPL